MPSGSSVPRRYEDELSSAVVARESSAGSKMRPVSLIARSVGLIAPGTSLTVFDELSRADAITACSVSPMCSSLRPLATADPSTAASAE